MTYEIKNNVPIPSRHGLKYPFAEMDVGDSFTVPADDPAAAVFKSGSSRVASGAHAWGNGNGAKFATRTNEDKSVTVWRVE